MMTKFLDTKQTTHPKRILFWTGSLLSLALALYTLHDMQTAEGAGLYLSILYGQSNRVPFDLMVDIMGMLLFLSLLLLPCLILRHLQLDSFFRLLAVSLAFMPVAHPGNTLHVIEHFLNLTLRESILQGDFLPLLFEEYVPAFQLLKVLLPFLLLLVAINKTLHTSGFLRKRYWLLFMLFFFVMYLLFENTAHTFLYLFYYFLLIWCFDEWEATCKHSKAFADWSLIMFAGCLLRGIYRMLDLISHAHL